MTVPKWLRAKPIAVQFRTGKQAWQPVIILLNKNGGSYSTPNRDEVGIFRYLTHGTHPDGGDVVTLHWKEKHGPLKGHTGVDTLWCQQRDRDIEVRGTFFLDDGSDYGEISTGDRQSPL